MKNVPAEGCRTPEKDVEHDNARKTKTCRLSRKVLTAKLRNNNSS